jgi:hypothetical protein
VSCPLVSRFDFWYHPKVVKLEIKIPDDLAREMRLDGANASRRALEMLALAGYRSLELSAGQVGQMLNLSFHQTEEFLQDHDAPSGLGVEEHLRGRENLERILKQAQ